MTRRSFYFLFLITLLCFSGAVFLYRKDMENMVETNGPLLSGLSARTENTAALVFTRKGQPLTLIKNKTGDWSLLEAAGYPVGFHKISSFINLLDSLKKEKAGTALPEFYFDEGLTEDEACQIALFDENGDILADLFAGKAVSDGYFVRAGGDMQTYTVKTPQSLCPDKASDWLDMTLFSLPVSNVQSVTYSLPQEPERFIRLTRSRSDEPLKIDVSDDFFIFFDTEDAAKEFAAFNFSDFKHADSSFTPTLAVETLFFDGLKIIRMQDDERTSAFSFDATAHAAQETKAAAKRLNALFSKWLYRPADMQKDVLNPFLPIGKDD